MMPYAFAAWTVKSGGKAANDIVKESIGMKIAVFTQEYACVAVYIVIFSGIRIRCGMGSARLGR